MNIVFFGNPHFASNALNSLIEKNGDYEDALALYHQIKIDFKSSQEASGIEKYISRAENR